MHRYGLIFFNRKKRGGEGNVLDVSAAQLERGSEKVEVRGRSSGTALGQTDCQISLRSSRDGKGKMDCESQPAQESLIEVLPQVCSQDGHAVVHFHLLQQVAGLDIGVSIVRVRYFSALSEERVGLIEEQDRVGGFGGVEDAGEFFSVSPMYLLTTPARSTL